MVDRYFTDRIAWEMLGRGETFLDLRDEMIVALQQDIAERKTLVCHVPVEFGMASTDTVSRPDRTEELRVAYDRAIQEVLCIYKVSHIVVTGTVAERVDQVKRGMWGI